MLKSEKFIELLDKRLHREFVREYLYFSSIGNLFCFNYGREKLRRSILKVRSSRNWITKIYYIYRYKQALGEWKILKQKYFTSKKGK